MLFQLVIRGLVLTLGYLYPAYECYKAVEKTPGRLDVDQLKFWTEYWMIMAVVTVAERVLDVLISWLPMYAEAKLLFIVWLWYDKTRGTTYVYQTFLKPLVAKHEPEIDHHLNQFKARAGNMAVQYWQQGCTWARERLVDLVHYAAAQAPGAVAGQRQQAQRGPPQRGYRGSSATSEVPPMRTGYGPLVEDQDELQGGYEVVDEPPATRSRSADLRASAPAPRLHKRTTSVH